MRRKKNLQYFAKHVMKLQCAIPSYLNDSILSFHLKPVVQLYFLLTLSKKKENKLWNGLANNITKHLIQCVIH